MRETSVYETLLKAHDIIAEKGLAKQMHRDPETGAMDVDGAILAACGAKVGVLVCDVNDVLPATSVAKYTAALWKLDREVECGDIVEWTDRPEVTKEQVLDLIKRAAEKMLIS